LTIAALVHIREIAAGVCFYGSAQEFADPAKLKAPFQGHFANRDGLVHGPARSTRWKGAMKAAGAAPEIIATTRPTRFQRAQPCLDLASANQAWERTASFLGKRL